MNFRCADKVVRLLGLGTFGKVVECVDIKTQRRVAIKIIRAIPKYRDASKIEIRVLQKLKEKDSDNGRCVTIIFQRAFMETDLVSFNVFQ